MLNAVSNLVKSTGVTPTHFKRKPGNQKLTAKYWQVVTKAQDCLTVQNEIAE